jgi:hypothetical protein
LVFRTSQGPAWVRFADRVGMGFSVGNISVSAVAVSAASTVCSTFCVAIATVGVRVAVGVAVDIIQAEAAKPTTTSKRILPFLPPFQKLLIRASINSSSGSFGMIIGPPFYTMGLNESRMVARIVRFLFAVLPAAAPVNILAARGWNGLRNVFNPIGSRWMTEVCNRRGPFPFHMDDIPSGNNLFR